MKAHDRRPRLFNHCAQARVEGRADWPCGNGGWIDAGLGIVGREPLAPARLDFQIGRRLGVAKEVHVERRARGIPDSGDLFAQAVGREHGRRQ
jgi:hypothetical protein